MARGDLAVTARSQILRPWAEIGTDVPKGASAGQILKHCKLNWEVEVEQLLRADGKTKSVTGRSIVRKDTGDELCPCGPEYVPAQNHDVFDFFQRFCRTGGLALETVGGLDGGRHIWAMAKMQLAFTLPGKDRTEAFMLLSHPHLYGKSLTILLIPRRVTCLNQVPLLLSSNLAQRYRMSHVKEFDQKEQIKAEAHLVEAQRSFELFGKRAKGLAGVGVKGQEPERYFAELFQPKLLESGGKIKADDLNTTVARLMQLKDEQPGAEMSRDSWWSLLNAVTYFVDHEQGKDANVRCREAWFGKRAGLKRRALTLALDASGVYRVKD